MHASRQREFEESQRVAQITQRKAEDSVVEARAALKREKGNIQRRLSDLEEQTTAVSLREQALAESELVLRKEMAQKSEREQKLLRREAVNSPTLCLALLIQFNSDRIP